MLHSPWTMFTSHFRVFYLQIRGKNPKQVQLSFTRVATWRQCLSGHTSGAETFERHCPPPHPFFFWWCPLLLWYPPPQKGNIKLWHLKGDEGWQSVMSSFGKYLLPPCYLSLLTDELLTALWPNPLQIRAAVDWWQRERELEYVCHYPMRTFSLRLMFELGLS